MLLRECGNDRAEPFYSTGSAGFRIRPEMDVEPGVTILDQTEAGLGFVELGGKVLESFDARACGALGATLERFAFGEPKRI